MSSVAPSAISIAGSDVPSSMMSSADAIGYVSSVGYLGVLVGPPLLGGLSSLLGGLGWSFLVDSGFMLLMSCVALGIRLRTSNPEDNTYTPVSQ